MSASIGGGDEDSNRVLRFDSCFLQEGRESSSVSFERSSSEPWFARIKLGLPGLTCHVLAYFFLSLSANSPE